MSPQPAPSPKQKRSTGPRTESGKAASSQNALRHGLASGTLLIEGEDASAWQSLLTGLLAEWQPASVTERLLVENMAKHHWLVERALRLQSEALSFNRQVLSHQCQALSATGAAELPPSFAVLLRYQTANERAFSRALKSLQDMQKARREFVSQTEQSEILARLSAPLPPVNHDAVFAKLASLRAAAKPSTPQNSANVRSSAVPSAPPAQSAPLDPPSSGA